MWTIFICEAQSYTPRASKVIWRNSAKQSLVKMRIDALSHCRQEKEAFLLSAIENPS